MDQLSRNSGGTTGRETGVYAKVFDSIYSGSLRGKPHEQLVFIYLLVNSWQTKGVCDIHPSRISDDIGLSREEVDSALDYLQRPDPESRSMELAGRRIELIDAHRAWGWRIVNWAKYNAIQRTIERKEYYANYFQEVRKPRKAASTHQYRKIHESTEERRGEEKREEEINQQTLPYASSMRRAVGVRRKALENGEKLPEGEITADQAFDEIFWPEYPRKKDKEPARKAWKALKLKDTDEAQILAIMKALRRDVKEEWRDRTPDKIPYGATWLHRKGWLDG